MDIDPVMARIVIPSIHVSLPVYHGTDSRTLADGVGHLFGTSLPIGGPSTHAVLTGHTGLSTATMFDNLTQVKKGDAFYVSSLGQTLKYEVIVVAVIIILTVVAGILGRLWWLRRCARLAARAERTEDSEDTEDSAGIGVSHDAQDADEADDVGGAERWPGRRLKDVSAPPVLMVPSLLANDRTIRSVTWSRVSREQSRTGIAADFLLVGALKNLRSASDHLPIADLPFPWDSCVCVEACWPCPAWRRRSVWWGCSCSPTPARSSMPWPWRARRSARTT